MLLIAWFVVTNNIAPCPYNRSDKNQFYIIAMWLTPLMALALTLVMLTTQ